MREETRKPAERGGELDEIGSPDNALEKELEKELLSKKLTPAKPVGLRYDRLEKEGFVCSEREMTPEASYVAPKSDEDIASQPSPDIASASSTDVCATSSEASNLYFVSNRLLISSLLVQCKTILVASGEGWLHDLFWSGEKEIVRVCLSSFASAVQKRSAMPVEAYEQLSYRDSSYDGVAVDSSILLSNNVRASLEEFRRILKPGGRICVVAVNWEYEMAGRIETYETSFRRYGGKVYLGLFKRTLSPPKEIEYVCLLDPRESLVRKLASMEREELRVLGLTDVPGAVKAVVSAELIEIPQFTGTSLKDVCAEAGFSSVVVSGAPGILAFRLLKGVFSVTTQTAGSPAKSDPAPTTLATGPGAEPAAPATPVTGPGAEPAAPTTPVTGAATKSAAALTLFGRSYTIMNDIPQCSVCAFPFISSVDNPHVVAVCAR